MEEELTIDDGYEHDVTCGSITNEKDDKKKKLQTLSESDVTETFIEN